MPTVGGEAVDTALPAHPVGHPHVPGGVDGEAGRAEEVASALAVAVPKARQDAPVAVELVDTLTSGFPSSQDGKPSECASGWATPSRDNAAVMSGSATRRTPRKAPNSP
jgi:hypothetical protein